MFCLPIHINTICVSGYEIWCGKNMRELLQAKKGTENGYKMERLKKLFRKQEYSLMHMYKERNKE